jgi:hypothetical protein
MSTIPISTIVSIVPGVVAGGGAASVLTGVVMSQDVSVPGDQVLSFTSAADVSSWFGPAAPETLIANNYFPGIVNGGQLPGQLQFARDFVAAAGAEVFGAQLGSLTLAQLQALSGTLIVTTSAPFTSASINLSAATSFANAASIMTAGFTTPDFAITYDATRNRFLLTTNTTGPSTTVSAVTGTLATGVGLSSAAGAHVQATGYAIDTPSTAMNRLVGITTNFGTFTTAWVPTIGDRLLFAQWNSGQNYQYLYVSADVEAAGLTANNAASFGAQVFAAPYQGTIPLYGGVDFAGAIMGYAASINFNITNGRTDGAFRTFNSGLAATVSSQANAAALNTNNYTYYGAYANAANNYTIVYDGAVSGAFLWTDTYLDQIYLNRELQRSLFEALLAYNSLPYNQDGYTALYRAGADVATAALTSGIIRAGVTLSQSQAQIVNSQAGRAIAPSLSTTGWYLLIGDPANVAQARQNRTSPDAQFWYTDGGSIQNIVLNSRAVI